MADREPVWVVMLITNMGLAGEMPWARVFRDEAAARAWAARKSPYPHDPGGQGGG